MVVLEDETKAQRTTYTHTNTRTHTHTRTHRVGTHELVVGEVGSLGVEDEPPGRSSHSGSSHVDADDHVAEEEPLRDEGLLGVAWWLVHDVEVGRVEGQGGGGQAICHQVYPQQLHWNQRLRHAQSCGQEDAHDLSGGDEGGDWWCYDARSCIST